MSTELLCIWSLYIQFGKERDILSCQCGKCCHWGMSWIGGGHTHRITPFSLWGCYGGHEVSERTLWSLILGQTAGPSSHWRWSWGLWHLHEDLPHSLAQRQAEFTDSRTSGQSFHNILTVQGREARSWSSRKLEWASSTKQSFPQSSRWRY